MTDIEIPEGFTRWGGGECPVDPEAKISYIMRDGSSCSYGSRAHQLDWKHPALDNSSCDIIAYRVLP